MIKAALEVSLRCAPKLTKRLPNIARYGQHKIQRCERAFNDAAMRMIKSALVLGTKRFPKIGRLGQHKIQRCSVHMNKKQKQTIPQIWKYWITSTMSWHLKANCNVKNPSVCFLLAHQFKFVSFPPEKFEGRVNPQIQARCAEDVDGVRQAEYWVKLKLVCSSCSSTCCLCRQWGLLTSGIHGHLRRFYTCRDIQKVSYSPFYCYVSLCPSGSANDQNHCRAYAVWHGFFCRAYAIGNGFFSEHVPVAMGLS